MVNFFQKKATELAYKNRNNWINSYPLTLKGLKGKVVLLDFWTYSCVNCLRTLSSLKKMWKKYQGKNVMIIGIHTPEFDFEKNLDNVKSAVERHNIEYPVLSDPERINWDNYGNTYWPRAALIDSGGNIIFEHIGESGYGEIDSRISQELESMGTHMFDMLITEKKRPFAIGISPETYAGSARSIGIGSSKVCTKGGCDEFFDNGSHSMNIIYPHGKWVQKPEFLESKGEGKISFRFLASEVNIVMSGSGLAEVRLDGKFLKKEQAGTDVLFRNKRSYVKIDKPDIYNIIRIKHPMSADLELAAFSGLRIYAYTFG